MKASIFIPFFIWRAYCVAFIKWHMPTNTKGTWPGNMECRGDTHRDLKRNCGDSMLESREMKLNFEFDVKYLTRSLTDIHPIEVNTEGVA